jgi:hypothetical protein
LPLAPGVHSFPLENNLSESSFGGIGETRGGPRVIQLGLKLRF